LTPAIHRFRLEDMKVIILTGGIGSGKSTVSAILKELGAEVIDSDRLGHKVLEPGTSGWQETVELFGRDILRPDGTIDRGKLAAIVFHDPEKLQKLNKIVHPRVDKEVEALLEKYDRAGAPAAFIEMGILVEGPWKHLVNEVWIVKSPRDVVLKRLKERGMSESAALARMAFQPPPEEKTRHKKTFIQNDGSLTELRAQVEKLWKELHNKDRI
jgi:dephospho-CoA kinase